MTKFNFYVDYDLSEIEYTGYGDNIEGPVHVDMIFAGVPLYLQYQMENMDKHTLRFGNGMENCSDHEIDETSLFDRTGVSLSRAIEMVKKDILVTLIERNDYEEGEPDDWRDRVAS